MEEGFQDLANLAEEFQVKTTIKFTGEPRKYKGRKLFKDTWQTLADIDWDVEVKSEGSKSQQSRAPNLAKFTLFPKLPLEVRRKIWGFTVEPRLIEETYYRQYGEGPGPQWKKTVRSLFPINIVPYGSMPASFWACSESRNEVARYYKDIAAIPETRTLCKTFPETPIEDIRALLHSDSFSLDQAIVNFKRLCEEDSSLPLPPSVPFNPDQDIIHFDSLKCLEIGHLLYLEPELQFLLHDEPLPENRDPWRIDYYSFQLPLILHPSLVKRVQTTPQSLLRFHDDHFERHGGRSPSMIFIDFVYQDLDELIIQDFDCKFPHKLDLPENRELWKEWILRMFKLESAHGDYAWMREGSAFKVPKITIRPGAKIARPCYHCSEIQKYDRKQLQQRKQSRYEWKIYYGNLAEKDTQDEEDSDESDCGCYDFSSDFVDSFRK